jgi:hypothetical protein
MRPRAWSSSHLAHADDELERLTAVAAAVELLPVGEGAGVVHLDLLALLREGRAITWGKRRSVSAALAAAAAQCMPQDQVVPGFTVSFVTPMVTVWVNLRKL